MTNYQPCHEFYRLDWHHSSSADSPVIGSLGFTSMHKNHNEAERHIPVGSIIAPGSDALENFLHQLSPARVDFVRIRSWLRQCDRAQIQDSPSHSLCTRDSYELLHQLRVIDCHTRRIVTEPLQFKLVALSYSWGPLVGVQGDEDFNLQSDPPRTINDSITATLELGYSYLWIDRYVSAVHYCMR